MPTIVTLVIAVVMLFPCAFARADELPRFRTWKVSVAALAASQAADIASSYGRQGTEQNPVFGNTFTGRDAAIKIGVTAATVLVQHRILKRYPQNKFARMFAAVNFGAAGVTTVTAYRNWNIE